MIVCRLLIIQFFLRICDSVQKVSFCENCFKMSDQENFDFNIIGFKLSPVLKVPGLGYEKNEKKIYVENLLLFCSF